MPKTSTGSLFTTSLTPKIFASYSPTNNDKNKQTSIELTATPKATLPNLGL